MFLLSEASLCWWRAASRAEGIGWKGAALPTPLSSGTVCETCASVIPLGTQPNLSLPGAARAQGNPTFPRKWETLARRPLLLKEGGWEELLTNGVIRTSGLVGNFL